MFEKINFLALTLKNSSISGNETLHFSVKAQKIKNPPREIFQEREVSKKLLIFSQKKAFFTTESYEKASYILGSNFPSSKNKKDF